MNLPKQVYILWSVRRLDLLLLGVAEVLLFTGDLRAFPTFY